LYEETSLKKKKEVVLSGLFFKVIKLCLQTKSGSKKTARLLYKSCFKNYFLNNFFSCECLYKDFDNENDHENDHENVTHKSIKIFDFFKKKTLKLKKNKQFFGSSKQKSFFYNKKIEMEMEMEMGIQKKTLNKQKKSNKKFFFLTNFYLKRIYSLDHNFCLPSLRKGIFMGWKKKSEADNKIISNNFFLFHYFSKLLSAGLVLAKLRVGWVGDQPNQPNSFEMFLLKNLIPINNTSFNNQRKWFLQANKKFYKIQNVLFFLKKKNYLNLFEINSKKQTNNGNFYKGKEESFWCGECAYKELKFISLQKFISKLQINKETQDQTPVFITVNLLNLNHNFPSLYLFLKKAKLFFFKSYFFSAHSLPFENRQIHRFIYFCLNQPAISKRAENPFLTQTNLPFINWQKISLEKSYNLDIFLFSFLYMWAKNQHENHSNSWVFNKYWVFLQPLAYFFYNIIQIGITSQNIYFKKKSYILQDIICKKLISKLEKNTNYLRKENIFFYKTKNFSTCAGTSFVFYKVFRCKLNKVLNRVTKSSLNLKKVDDDFFAKQNIIIIKGNEFNKNLKKKRILKTWYLENYKATFPNFKIDVNREQKKFKFYFTKLKLFKNIKLNSLPFLCCLFHKNAFRRKKKRQGTGGKKTCLTCCHMNLDFEKKTLNQELEKDFYKKIFVSKDFKNLKYKHIKFYLTKRDFYLNKPFKNLYPNLFLPAESIFLGKFFDQP
jgi:hypothetical protein